MANIRYNKQKVDGSDMIFPKPQHLKGSSYVDTGDGNPFPTMLYGVDDNGKERPVNVDKDGNVLTRQTGSIVEYWEDEEIAAGETLQSDFLHVEYATKIIMTISVREEKSVRSDLDLTVHFKRGDGRGKYIYTTKPEPVNESSGYRSFEFKLYTPYFRINLKNESDKDGGEIQINLYGVNN